MTNTDKWAQLDAAMTESAKKTIKELFAEDKDRAAKFSSPSKRRDGSSTTRRTASTKRS